MATRLTPSARFGHIALVGESEHDVREVMIEGPAGLLRTAPRSERPVWTSSRFRLEWPNGAVAEAFSADDPDSLRGPQFDAAWCDELAKWRYADATLRHAAIRPAAGRAAAPAHHHDATADPAAEAADRRSAHRGDARRPTANAAHLSPAFLDEVLARYAGTRLGRQEIDGEIIEDRPDALVVARHHRGRARR